MDLLKVVYSFASVAGLGILLGLGLAVASRLLKIKRDKRIEELENVLPGINCGACGYAGCASYAEAIVTEGDELTKCSPGGASVAEELARYMGVTIEVSDEKLVAQVHCRGGRDRTKRQFSYEGLEDCNGIYIVYNGDKECKFGCLGYGSCIKVCPVDAIDYTKDGLVWVDKDVCISCGKCIDVCPTGVMQWIPYDADDDGGCSSTDKGAQVKKYCEVGCIGCKLCAKKSPEGGYVIENFLSRIDYAQSGDRSEGAAACPTNCIYQLNQRVVETSDKT
jgi:Na+-translocating ferredoxin:NAD+ oxidoreductase RNF subunit RnfB